MKALLVTQMLTSDGAWMKMRKMKKIAALFPRAVDVIEEMTLTDLVKTYVMRLKAGCGNGPRVLKMPPSEVT
jgi:hypothetical protein